MDCKDCHYERKDPPRGGRSSLFRDSVALRPTTLVVSAVALALLWAPATAGAYVYWASAGTSQADKGSIGRANLEGSGINRTWISDAASPTGIAVDAGHFYWANLDTHAIGRADIDGTAVDPAFVTGVGSPQGIAVDDDYIYWASPGSDSIGRADIDGGGGKQNLITGATDPYSVAVGAGYLYWAKPLDNSIGRARLDGTDVNQTFINNASSPTGIAVDAGHIYWGSYYGTSIGRAGLDGSGVDNGFIDGARAFGIAVNADHIYWASPGSDSIGHAEVDGSDADPRFITRVRGPYGVALDSGASGPPPKITELRVRPRRFAAGSAVTPLERVTGTRIEVRLSKSARVHFRVRHDPPRKHGGPPPTNPHAFARQLDQGRNSFSFTGTLRGRTFPPGRYLLIARARDSANQASRRVSAKFRIE